MFCGQTDRLNPPSYWTDMGLKSGRYLGRDCPATEYVSEETTVTEYANLHLLLEQMRVRAHRNNRGAASNSDHEASHIGVEPPRVLVVGPESSGKTPVCKILINYAVRGPLQRTHSSSTWIRVMYVPRLPGCPPLIAHCVGGLYNSWYNLCICN